jgi:hypothetical protein
MKSVFVALAAAVFALASAPTFAQSHFPKHQHPPVVVAGDHPAFGHHPRHHHHHHHDGGAVVVPKSHNAKLILGAKGSHHPHDH